MVALKSTTSTRYRITNGNDMGDIRTSIGSTSYNNSQG